MASVKHGKKLQKTQKISNEEKQALLMRLNRYEDTNLCKDCLD